MLEDRRGNQRIFPLLPASFLLEGKLVTLQRPVREVAAPQPRRTASGSVAVPNAPARVARAGRIYVEGVHDAQLVEQVWGDDLRVEGVVVEPLHGVDDLPAVVADFGPGKGRRLGVLVDHLVAGSKESRIVAELRNPYVLVTGHPYVDIWEAVKPASVGIPGLAEGAPWPGLERGRLRRAGRFGRARDVAPGPLFGTRFQRSGVGTARCGRAARRLCSHRGLKPFCKSTAGPAVG